MVNERIGVIYRKSDYPGILIRVLIDIIDFAAILITAAVFFLTVFSGVEDDLAIGRILFGFFVLGFGYLGPWKASGIPTLGYLICRVKIVNSKGDRVSIWQATGRALLLFFGPMNYLFDLFWLYGETPRQAFRDKLSGTFLISKSAIVESEGKVVRKVLHVMGYRAQVEDIQRVGP